MLLILPFSRTHCWIGGVFGFVVAGVCAAGGWCRGSDHILQISGAVQINRIKHQQLVNILGEVSNAAGIRSPSLFLIDDPQPNSFAIGNSPDEGTVVVTTSLVQTLEREELQAVLAHEVAHLAHNDGRYFALVTALLAIVPAIRNALIDVLAGLWDLPFVLGAIWIYLVALTIIGCLFGLGWISEVALKLAVGRQREFLADARAVEITRNSDALMSALIKLYKTNHRQSAITSIYTSPLCIVDPADASNEGSAHPSLSARLRAINSLMGRSKTIIFAQD